MTFYITNIIWIIIHLIIAVFWMLSCRIINLNQIASLLNINEIKDLRPGSTMMEISQTKLRFELQMEESSDLQTWKDTGTPSL